MKALVLTSILVAAGIFVSRHFGFQLQPDSRPSKEPPVIYLDLRPIPGNRSERLTREGEDAERAHNFSLADHLLEQAIEAADKDKNDQSVREPLYALAQRYYQDGKYDKAEPLMLRMVQMRDKDLAELPQTLKRAEHNSKKDSGELFRLGNPFPPYPKDLANIYEKTGRSSEAEKFLKHTINAERCLSLWHVGADLVLLADFYASHNSWQKALPLLEERYEQVNTWDRGLMSDNFDSLHKLVICMRKMDLSAKAVHRLELPIDGLRAQAQCSHDLLNSWNPLDKVSVINPHIYENILVILYTDKGDCLKDIKDRNGARDAYNAALELDPNCKTSLDGLASLSK